MASLCDGAVYYGELTHQRGLGEETDDGQLEEDFHQVGGGSGLLFHTVAEQEEQRNELAMWR